MPKDWTKQVSGQLAGPQKNPFYEFKASFDAGTSPTLLDSSQAKKVVSFIRALTQGETKITTGNPAQNSIALIIGEKKGVLKLELQTALIHDLYPYLGGDLNLEGFMVIAGKTGSLYKGFRSEGLCITNSSEAGILRLLGENATDATGGAGFKYGGGDDLIWTLPDADGAADEVLQTDGNKVLSWGAGGGGGIPNIDGGTPDSVYLVDQNADGGDPSSTY